MQPIFESSWKLLKKAVQVRIKSSFISIRNMLGASRKSEYVIGFYIAILILAWVLDWYIFRLFSLLFSVRIFMILYAEERKYLYYGRKMLKWVYKSYERLFGLQRKVQINPYKSNRPKVTRNAKKLVRNTRVGSSHRCKCTYCDDNPVVLCGHCKTKAKIPVFDNMGRKDEKSNFIEEWDISCLTTDHMKEFFKICMEKSCCKVLLSDHPISTNLCKTCKPARGKSIDFYQFLTRANGRIQYFCGCIRCRNGDTDSCIKNYCELCTVPRIVFTK